MATYSLADVQAMSEPDQGGRTYTLGDVAAMQKAEPSFTDLMVKRETSDLSRNLRRGVRDVIDTGAEFLASGFDKLAGTKEADRVRAMNQQARAEYDAENSGILPAVQRVGGNILGALPVTNALGAGVGAMGARGLGAAISSGGMSTGRALGPVADMATRIAGGGINGYVSAGLADPTGANAGGAIGALAPPVLRGTQAAYSGALRGVRGAMLPADMKAARDIASISGTDVGNLEELARLRAALAQQGPVQLPGAESTVAQILQTPGASQLQRSIKATAPAALTEREAAQNLARLQALERIAPVSEGGAQQAADDVGNAISGYAIPAREQATTRVRAAFDAVDPFNDTRLFLPTDRMQGAADRYLGPGTFGGGNRVQQAIGTARGVSGETLHDGQVVANAVPWRTVQNLRSSIGEAAEQAASKGANKEAAALRDMVTAIDSRIGSAITGSGQIGEHFPRDIADQYRRALDMHADKMRRFETGPQAGMFRRGGDGMPQIQGAEIPRNFFSNRASQVEDAQSFLRLTNRDPGLLRDLKRFAMTDAAGQTDSFGHLTNAKFNRWLDSRDGATGVIFNESERATLKAIADDLHRAASAESLGRSKGSDTAQKIASMTGLGLVDSTGANLAASNFPAGRAALDFFRGPARAAKAERIGGLLADPERLSGLLGQFIATQKPKAQGLLSPAMNPLMYRTAPLLYSPGGSGGGG